MIITKVECLRLIYLSLSFFKPIVIMRVLSVFFLYPGDLYSLFFYILLFLTLLEILVVIVPFKKIINKRSIKLLVLHIVSTCIVFFNLIHSVFILLASVP